jgi:hypothetical protein
MAPAAVCPEISIWFDSRASTGAIAAMALRVTSVGYFEPSGNIGRPSWSSMTMLSPSSVGSTMRLSAISVMSGFACQACLMLAAAAWKSWSYFECSRST